MAETRRGFFKQAAGALVAAPLLGELDWHSFAAIRAQRERTPFPFVDGLTMMGPPDEVAASGLLAFITDVSAPERLRTTDGSIRYFRSYEACKRSVIAMRGRLTDGKIPGARPTSPC